MSLKHSYQPRRKTDRERAGLAGKVEQAALFRLCRGRTMGPLLRREVTGWRGQFGAHSVPWPAEGTGRGLWDGTVWYSVSPSQLWGQGTGTWDGTVWYPMCPLTRCEDREMGHEM